MASSQTNNRISSKTYIRSYVMGRTADSTGGSTADAHPGGYVDFRDYGCGMVRFHKCAGTGTLAKFAVYAYSTTTGATETLVREKTLTSNPDAIDDQVDLEFTQQEIAPLASDLRYLRARLAHDTASDRASVTWILAEPRFPRGDLTSDIIA